MIKTSHFAYQPLDSECEKASSSYLMSLVAIIGGLPLPIINLFATFFFFLAHRRGTYFVRWHCMQALLSQLSLLPFNSICFWWTIHIVLSREMLSNEYFTYLFTILILNIVEFIATIYASIQVRKGIHVKWWFYSDIADLVCKEDNKIEIV